MKSRRTLSRTGTVRARRQQWLLGAVLLAACSNDVAELNTDYYGPIALDGDTVVAASSVAVEDVIIGERAGDGWSEAARFAVAPRMHGPFLGLAGDTLAVGLPVIDPGHYVDEDPDLVTLFSRREGTWIADGELTKEDDGNDFGVGVDVEGDTLVVGAPPACSLLTQSSCTTGLAHVFERTEAGWSEQATLRGSGTPDEQFGWAVAIANDTIAIESLRHVDVFVREASGWAHAQEIALEGEPRLSFFRFDGETLAVHDDDTGEVVVLARDGDAWSVTQRLPTSDIKGLALEGDVIAVSTPGSLFVYEREGGVWSNTIEIIAEEDTLDDFGEFHGPVAVSGETIAALYGGNPDVEIFELEDLRSDGCAVAPGSRTRASGWWLVAAFVLLSYASTRFRPASLAR